MRYHPRLRAPAIPKLAPLLLIVLLTLLLAACGGPRSVKPRVFAPSASVQELRRSGEEQWTLVLRLQNFSNVGMRMERIDARLTIAEGAAMQLDASPGLTVAPDSAEPYPLGFQLNVDAARSIADALASGRSINYQLKGRIDSSEPKSRSDDFDFESSLTPVPGLTGTLR